MRPERRRSGLGLLQRIADLRAFAAKKQKVARLLIESDLAEEAPQLYRNGMAASGGMGYRLADPVGED